MNAEHAAAEAQRLLNEPLLAEAFYAVRMNALVALAEVDPADIKEITRLQAIAACLQDVRDQLQAHILASGRDDGGVPVESKPTA